MEFFQFIQEYGPLAGAVLFFIWRDWGREDRMNSRIEKLEDEQRSVLLPLVREATAVISKNTEVMERLEEVMSDAHKPKP